MISSKKFLATKCSKKLPPVIREHRFFKNNKQVPKIFAQIGLPNDRVNKAYNDPRFGMLDLVFSSSGTQCLYDLATMSMRGALSCMHWDNHHSSHVIGTVVDPFCAMIYLTDRKHTKYGRSIIKRSLVRLVARSHDHKPFLFIERPYTKSNNTDPSKYDNHCPFPIEIIKVFVDYLSSKTGLEVRSPWSGFIACYRPRPTPLNTLFDSELSASDFVIPNAGNEVADKWLKELSPVPVKKSTLLA